ncbi:MAG: flippase-like domain-containing protein [Burkholderiales bacterium]|nr:flippase-like domain-containing protein [Burkholderiales bacterium]
MKRLGPRLVAWAGLVLSLVILTVLLAGLDWAQFRRAAAQVPLWAWAAGSAGVMASHVLRALRLRAEWRPRTGATLGECLRLALLHNAAVLLLPFRTGEAGYAWWLHRSWGVSLAEALHSLLWLRLQDLAVLGLLAVLLMAPLPGVYPALLTGVLALLLIVGLPALLRRLARQFSAAANPAGGVEADGADDDQRRQAGADAQSHVNADSATLASPDPAARPAGALRLAVARIVGKILQAVAARRSGASSWVYAVTNWSLRLLVVGGLLVSLGVLDLPTGLRAALGGELGALMPLQGPAGLGTYEAGVWAGAAWHDGLAGSQFTSRTAVAELAGAALAVHALWLATGLVAAAFAALATRLLPAPVRRAGAELAPSTAPPSPVTPAAGVVQCTSGAAPEPAAPPADDQPLPR